MTYKELPTLSVATTITGVGLHSMPFSAAHEIAEHLLGHPVWTHEFADKGLFKRLQDAAYGQFPLLPTADEARADHEAAAAKALAAYGETVTVKRGDNTRTESPIDSLVRIGITP